GPGIERRADVDADRAEAGLVAYADARAETERLEVGRRAGAHGTGIDERHDRERTVEEAGLDPRLERQFGERAAAGRIALVVARPDLAIAVAAHRSAAARVEPPRRRDVLDRRALDRAEPPAPCKHDGIADLLVVARVDLRADVEALGSVAARDLGRNPPAEPEAFGRVEQVVGRVVMYRHRKRADEVGLARLGRGVVGHRRTFA